MLQFVFEQSLSQPGMRVRSRGDAGLVGKSTGRTCNDGKSTQGNHSWDDIKDALEGTVIKQTITSPYQKARRYEAPFTLANREADYRTAWAFFAQPAGEVMDVAARNGGRS